VICISKAKSYFTVHDHINVIVNGEIIRHYSGHYSVSGEQLDGNLLANVSKALSNIATKNDIKDMAHIAVLPFVDASALSVHRVIFS
jgi:hypothetical protein